MPYSLLLVNTFLIINLFQVRRIVGTLIAVATGRISLEEVKYMLDTPSKHSWDNRIVVAPAHGLYLLDVEYDSKELQLPEVDTTIVTTPSGQENNSREQLGNNEPFRVSADVQN